jgi:chromosome segregation protein
VNPDFKREDDRLNLDIETAKGATKSAIQGLAANWNLQSKLRKLTTARDSLRQRAEALEKTLPALSESDQAIIERFDKSNDFESKRIQASKHADQILHELDAPITALMNERDLTTDIKGDAEAIQQRYRDLHSAFAAGMKQLKTELTDKRAGLSTAEAEWAAKFKEWRTARDGVLEKLGAHKTVTTQIIKLREEISEFTNQIGDLDAKLKAESDPASTLKEALAELKLINDQRAKRTQEWAKEIETLSSGKIKAVVDVARDTSEIKDAVDTVGSKTGSQEATRLTKLEEAMASDSVWNVLDRLRTDCLSLLYWRQMGAASGDASGLLLDIAPVQSSSYDRR